MTRLLRGLALSCHPLPCIAVTAFVTGYAWSAGGRAGLLVLIAAAVLTGQLAVGWTNDAIDAPADTRAGRTDKPIAAGQVARSTVLTAAVLALLACVVLSLRLGLTPGLLHLLAVGSALSYNLALKWTVASPLPYLLSFGLVPVVVSTAVDGAEPPGVLVTTAAVLLGGAAHFGNTIGDAEADALTGVRGLPQRIGPVRSQVVTALALAAAAALLLADVLTAGQQSPMAIALLVLGVLAGAAGAVLHIGITGGRSAFRLTLLAVALVVTGFLLAT